MKSNPQEPKPNQLQEKFIVIGYLDNGTIQAFGTPSGRAFHGPMSADRAIGVLQALNPNVRFLRVEVTPYLEVASTPATVV